MRPIDTLVTVASENAVKSPLTGRTAAFLHIALFEDRGAHEPHLLGEVILGDLVALDEVGEARHRVVVVARRTTVQFGAWPLAPILSIGETLPAELLPLATRGRGGPLSFREHGVMRGDTLRLLAVVEEQGERWTAREDRAPVVLEVRDLSP